MSVFFKIWSSKNPWYVDLVYALFFGALSKVMGKISIILSWNALLVTDFREIPLIIGTFYLSNPLYILVMVGVTSIPREFSMAVYTHFFMHLIPLTAAFYVYHFLPRFSSKVYKQGILWLLFSIAYYVILGLPAMIFFDYLFGYISSGLWENYIEVLQGLKFEILTTALVTTLFLMQHRMLFLLKAHEKELEKTVEQRTAELALANHKLVSMNEELKRNTEEIKAMNDNLDNLVKKRSKKIEEQLNLMIRYAHMNSHEVRAPLARLLGLLELLMMEKDEVKKQDIMEKLADAGKELDEIVRKMNRLLEKEIL